METIKNYLESMFRNLPATEKVLRAKSELFQMMEDKYTELIRDGKSENEAVGTVISEFGNLEELSADLGIADIFASTKTENSNKRLLSFDEVKGYLSLKAKSGKYIATGVLLCICSVIGPIIADVYKINEAIGVAAMFVMIGIGVAFFILSGTMMEDFTFLKKEACALDSVSSDYVNSKRKENMSSYSIKQSVGILLLILSILPPIIFDNHGIMEDLSAVFLFLFVAAGVYLLVVSNTIKNSFSYLLNLNSLSGSERDLVYANKTIKIIMSVYWPTITCAYLCISFLTFSWHISWLIWPIAAVVHILLRNIFGTDEE